MGEVVRSRWGALTGHGRLQCELLQESDSLHTISMREWPACKWRVGAERQKEGAVVRAYEIYALEVKDLDVGAK